MSFSAEAVHRTDLTPVDRADAIDTARFGIPHPHPFLAQLTITSAHLSRVIPHVWNIEYVRWIDRVAELHSDSAGYPHETLIEQNRIWFVARHEIDYEAEVWKDDELIIATWVRDFKRIRAWRETAIIRPADETVVCRAATLWVFVDLTERKPARIPEEMIRAFRPLNSEETAHARGHDHR